MVDHPCPRIRRFILQKSLNFGRCRRKPNQIKVGATDESAAGSTRDRREGPLFGLRESEAGNIILNPLFLIHLGKADRLQLLECPVPALAAVCRQVGEEVNWQGQQAHYPKRVNGSSRYHTSLNPGKRDYRFFGEPVATRSLEAHDKESAEYFSPIHLAAFLSSFQRFRISASFVR